MTDRQRGILIHSLGGESGTPGFRNRFATAPDCDSWLDVQALVADGFMRRGREIPGGLIYFVVTPAGQEAVGIKYKPQ